MLHIVEDTRTKLSHILHNKSLDIIIMSTNVNHVSVFVILAAFVSNIQFLQCRTDLQPNVYVTT